MLPVPPDLRTNPPVSHRAVKKINVLAMCGLLILALLMAYLPFDNAYILIVRHRGGVEYISLTIIPVSFNIGLWSFVVIVLVNSMIRMLILQFRRDRTTRRGIGNLAEKQPQPDTSRLNIPLIIDQQVSWPYFLRGAGYYVICCIAIFAAVFLAEYLLWQQVYFDPFTCVLWAAMALLVPLIWMFGARYMAYEQLVAMETGLVKRTKQQELFIPWHEVRFFAIDSTAIIGWKKNLWSFMRSDIPTYYELSSEHIILQWRWLRPPRWYELSIAQPTMGYDVYNQQMQTLLSIITTRTSQPLYDLRS